MAESGEDPPPPSPGAAARTVQGRMIRAELVGDHVEAERLMAVLRADGADFEVLAGAFVVAVHRRFASVSDLREVGRFVADQGAFAPGRASRREVEAAIRGALGEVHLLEAIAPEQMAASLWLVLAAVVTDLALSPAEVDRLIDTAERSGEIIERLGLLGDLGRTSPEVNPACWQLPHTWRAGALG